MIARAAADLAFPRAVVTDTDKIQIYSTVIVQYNTIQ